MAGTTGLGTTAAPRQAPSRDLALRIAGALLCLGTALTHVLDQGGFPGTQDPYYILILFYILEGAGLLTAVLLLARLPLDWLLALGVAAGPLLAYILTRTTGLPGHTDEIGNWAEPLGVASLVIEAALVVVVMVAVLGQAGGPRSA